MSTFDFMPTSRLNESLTKDFIKLPYFFGYKTGLFSFQNNSKNLDLSYKTDLDIWDCLERVNSYYSKIAKD